MKLSINDIKDIPFNKGTYLNVVRHRENIDLRGTSKIEVYPWSNSLRMLQKCSLKLARVHQSFAYSTLDGAIATIYIHT